MKIDKQDLRTVVEDLIGEFIFADEQLWRLPRLLVIAAGAMVACWFVATTEGRDGLDGVPVVAGTLLVVCAWAVTWFRHGREEMETDERVSPEIALGRALFRFRDAIFSVAFLTVVNAGAVVNAIRIARPDVQLDSIDVGIIAVVAFVGSMVIRVGCFERGCAVVRTPHRSVC